MLNLSQLEAFVETCRHGSYTLAAERLFISQPALHHKVKQLEAQLGVPLLVVSNRRVVPTAAGELLIDSAQAMLDEAARLERQFQGLADKDSIRVAAVSLLAAGALTVAVESFRETHPETAVVVDSMDSSDIVSALVSGRVELAVSYIDYVTADLEYELLTPTRIACAAAAEHPLCDGNPHAVRELLDYPIALTQKGMSLRTKIENWFRENASVDELRVSFEARTAAILALGVASSPNWITFMPHNAMPSFRLSEIIVDAPDVLSQPVVCYLPGRSMRQVVAEFLGVLRNAAAHPDHQPLKITLQERGPTRL
ncbi:MAG: LysR family transcriptional regulator [Dehalococcoidia bacterium]|nr:LysR family transcriptional regulator [Dehalococcoidia bacterium]